jgi:Mg2+ and Co2+ transporter CorA
MAESSGTRIALATFSGTALKRRGSTSVDEILSNVDRNANTFIHVVQTGVTLSRRILDHFALPSALAEQICAGKELELDTSSAGHLFKKFRFIEEAAPAEAGAAQATRTGVLIRGAETDRLMEGSASIVVGEKFVLLFEAERPSPMLAEAIETVLQRERELRERGIEYLLYRLAKTLFVDNYFDLMRRLLDRLQDLEAPLLEGSTSNEIYREVVRLRRQLNPFERSLSYVAEFIAEMAGEKAMQGGFGYLTGSLREECERLDNEFSMLRDRTSELIGTYRDNVNSRLSNIMRSLTVLSAIFMPLSFVTSFYGMNFTSIPAFNWVGGFPIAVAVMLAIAVGGLTFARRRNWL